MVLAALPTKMSNHLTAQRPWRKYRQPDVFLSEAGSTTMAKSTSSTREKEVMTNCRENNQRYVTLFKDKYIWYKMVNRNMIVHL